MKITYGDIIECPHCKGKKRVWYDGTHSMYYDSGWTTCPRCEGSGRMIAKTVTSTSLEPYKEEDEYG